MLLIERFPFTRMFLYLLKYQIHHNEYVMMLLEFLIMFFIIHIFSRIRVLFKIKYGRYRKIEEIDGVNIYFVSKCYGEADSYYGLNIYIDDKIENYNFRIYHELAHLNFNHCEKIAVILCLLSSLSNFLGNTEIKLLFYRISARIIYKIFQYIFEISADFQSLSTLNNVEIVHVKNLFKNRPQKFIEFLLGCHPSNQFRAFYVKQYLIKSFKNEKINFYSFFIEQLYNYTFKY